VKQTPWPFKKCASPREFLAALRATIPYRFKTWKTTWWIDDDHQQLVFTLTVNYVPSRDRDRLPLSIGDVLSADPYGRRNAKSFPVHRFAGYEQLHMTSGNGDNDRRYEGCFRLDLKHLPLVQKIVAERARLRDALTRRLANDKQLRDLDVKVDALRNAISDRIEQVRQEYHAANAAAETLVEDALGDERS